MVNITQEQLGALLRLAQVANDTVEAAEVDSIGRVYHIDYTNAQELHLAIDACVAAGIQLDPAC